MSKKAIPKIKFDKLKFKKSNSIGDLKKEDSKMGIGSLFGSIGKSINKVGRGATKPIRKAGGALFGSPGKKSGISMGNKKSGSIGGLGSLMASSMGKSMSEAKKPNFQ